MVIDFSTIDFKEKPTLILKNADNTAIQTLGYIHNLKAEIYYNETSSISFDLPAYVNGIKTPHYDDVVGMRVIDMLNWGQFILVNPSTTNDGIKEIKNCKAYSLEYELTYKKMSLENGTYNFWNPLSPESTILGIILSYLPSWSVGEVDNNLIGKYRTFEENNVNIYNLIKSTIQETYGCIFDFDTYRREINVKAVSSVTSTSPVYISFDNLAKEIKVEENTENIFTVLDVNGADGVTIRSVNPMGTNKIYNLDYYMNLDNFSDIMIEKWNNWKSSYENAQGRYYNITVEKMVLTSAILTKENKLNKLINHDLASLENQRSVYIEYLASLSDTDSAEYENYRSALSSINTNIQNKKADISALESDIGVLENKKNSITSRLTAINEETAFSNFFTNSEMLILDRYFKEDSISNSSFIATSVDSYSDNNIFQDINTLSLRITSSNIEEVEYDDDDYDGTSTLYTITGGLLSADVDGDDISAEIIKGTLEYNAFDDTVMFTCYLSEGEMLSTNFGSGTLSLMGSSNSITCTDTSLSFLSTSVEVYFTKNLTDYEQHQVEWELYDYGNDCLKKLAYPSHTFDVSAANFFMLDEFSEFVNRLALGNKIYVSLSPSRLNVDTDERILEPIFIGVSIDFENINSMELSFGDTYNLLSNTFELVDLLDQSISMGKTVDANRFGYNSFIDSGASTEVKRFMNSALDVSKNTVLSSIGMAISWDSSGIKCRKFTNDGTDYEPEQLAIINNNIVFTDDSWESAKMAIGHFTDKNVGDVWGIIAPNVVGTLLAGENLIIESIAQDGSTRLFKVDGDGAMLFNSDLTVTSGTNRQIAINPDFGIAIGQSGMVTTDGSGNKSLNTSKTKFRVDTNGNIRMQGIIQADDFLDSNGESMLETIDGVKTGKFDSKYLSLYGLEVTKSGRTTLEINRYGDLTMSGDLISSTITGSTVYGGTFYGGKYCATGQGRNNGAAYYIYSNARTNSDGNITGVNAGDLVGYISYDDNGAGTSSEANRRVFFTTINDTALKIQSASNMSISMGSYNSVSGKYTGTLYIAGIVDFGAATVKNLKITFG